MLEVATYSLITIVNSIVSQIVAERSFSFPLPANLEQILNFFSYILQLFALEYECYQRGDATVTTSNTFSFPPSPAERGGTAKTCTTPFCCVLSIQSVKSPGSELSRGGFSERVIVSRGTEQGWVGRDPCLSRVGFFGGSRLRRTLIRRGEGGGDEWSGPLWSPA